MTTAGFSKIELVDALHNHVCEVTFIKNNGDERHMQCTLISDYLPPQPARSASTPARAPNDEVVNCWDIDVGAWRSFRIDSILSFAILYGK